MRGSVRALLVGGALMAAGLGAAAPAAAAAAPPTLDTSAFVCSNGVCQAGPGNVGVGFSAVLIGIGPPYFGPECNPFLMSVASGSLPPGLQVAEPDCTWLITGTPKRAGTYAFTVQITPQPNSLGQPAGPSGTQQLTIIIGTGRADRLVVGAAGWDNGACSGLAPNLRLQLSDANSGATYTVTADGTGKQVATFTGTDEAPLAGTLRRLTVPPGAFPAQSQSRAVTVTDSVGGSVTVAGGRAGGC